MDTRAGRIFSMLKRADKRERQICCCRCERRCYCWPSPSTVEDLFIVLAQKRHYIDCVVIGSRRYSADLPQGGLEVPCKLIFNGKHEEIKKLKHLLARKTVVNK